MIPGDPIRVRIGGEDPPVDGVLLELLPDGRVLVDAPFRRYVRVRDPKHKSRWIDGVVDEGRKIGEYKQFGGEWHLMLYRRSE